jgi:threonine dehydratase
VVLAERSRIKATRVWNLVSCFERDKLVTEPSGASVLAVPLTGKVDGRGKRVGVTISGGTLGLEGFRQIVAGHDD